MTARRWTLMAGGLLLAAGLLVVIIAIDPGRARPREEPEEFGEVIELLPDELSTEAVDGGSLDPSALELQKGGWIEVVGKDGRLAQRYRFQRLDPSPPPPPEAPPEPGTSAPLPARAAGCSSTSPRPRSICRGAR